jgi:hypothetical protein
MTASADGPIKTFPLGTRLTSQEKQDLVAFLRAL